MQGKGGGSQTGWQRAAEQQDKGYMASLGFKSICKNGL